MCGWECLREGGELVGCCMLKIFTIFMGKRDDLLF